ncbi:hypothetical protein QT970_14350 [Microcoleus sp. herbarium8]
MLINNQTGIFYWFGRSPKNYDSQEWRSQLSLSPPKNDRLLTSQKARR